MQTGMCMYASVNVQMDVYKLSVKIANGMCMYASVNLQMYMYA